MTDLANQFKAATYIVVLNSNEGPEFQKYYDGMHYLFHHCGVHGDPAKPGIRRGSFNAINKATGEAEIYVSDEALLQELTPNASEFIKNGPVLKN